MMSVAFQNPQASLSKGLEINASRQFAPWLAAQQLSLAFTTYQTNRLFCVGTAAEERLALHERLFDKPMGLFVQGETLYMSTRYQLWQFDNLLAAGEVRQGCDRLYFPKTAHTTGDLNVHDVVIDGNGDLLFVNTDFSCLARLSADHSFEPLWQPAFISKLVAEDRCHLNGLALRDGQPAYMSACSATDTAAGWRDHRVAGGVVIDIQRNEIITTGLSMPHSPRWYQDKLWLLNSGTGEFGFVDLETQQFVPVTFCPGFVRGLAFWQNFAFVGLSKLRSRPFTGLALEERLTAAGHTPQCGLMVIDLNTGQVIHWLRIEGVVEELFDVVVLPGVRRPQSLGFQSDEIERLVTFPGSRGVVVTKPTVKRPSVGGTAPIAGVPREIWEQSDAEGPSQPAIAPPVPTSAPDLSSLKFQRVFHLNADNLAAYDDFTFPSLQQRWPTQPQRGELFGLSAAVEGAMVAFAIAELLSDRTADLISLYVAPAYRQQGIATRLLAYLEQELQQQNCRQMNLTYTSTPLTAVGLEPLLHKLDWQVPVSVGQQSQTHKALPTPKPLAAISGAKAPPPHPPATSGSPQVSLVMTVYNTDAYLAAALDSVLAQTFTDWELILWDDGSTDQSVEIAQTYAQRDARIRFQAAQHEGRIPALVKAHQLTQGEYVGWLDADDCLAPTALAETVTVLDAHAEYGMVYTNHIDMDPQGTPKGLGYRCQIPYRPHRLLIDMLTFHFRLLRQSVFAAVGG
ncbi:MAG: TIGR03032 family protein, partial [Cyanobacteria bacterium J06639_16]